MENKRVTTYRHGSNPRVYTLTRYSLPGGVMSCEVDCKTEAGREVLSQRLLSLETLEQVELVLLTEGYHTSDEVITRKPLR